MVDPRIAPAFAVRRTVVETDLVERHVRKWSDSGRERDCTYPPPSWTDVEENK